MKRFAVLLALLLLLSLSGCSAAVVAQTPTPDPDAIPPFGSGKDLIPAKPVTTPDSIKKWMDELAKKQNLPKGTGIAFFTVSDPDNEMILTTDAVWLRDKDKESKQVYYFLAVDKEMTTSFSISSYKGAAPWVSKSGGKTVTDEATLREEAFDLWRQYSRQLQNNLIKALGPGNGIEAVGEAVIINVGDFKGVLIPFSHKNDKYGKYGAFLYWGTHARTYECTIVASMEYWPFSYHSLLHTLEMFHASSLDTK